MAKDRKIIPMPEALRQLRTNSHSIRPLALHVAIPKRYRLEGGAVPLTAASVGNHLKLGYSKGDSNLPIGYSEADTTAEEDEKNREARELEVSLTCVKSDSRFAPTKS